MVMYVDIILKYYVFPWDSCEPHSLDFSVATEVITAEVTGY